MTTINVTKRTEDYHACIDGEPGLWDCGKTPALAVGSLIYTHRDRFGIEIDTGFLPQVEGQ